MSEVLNEELELQERAWMRNAVVRSLYRGWYRELAARLSPVDGSTVELGSGIGKLREAVPHVVLTDLAATRWADAVVDAQELPYEDRSVANLVLVDVLHHVPRPIRFFDEATRVLVPGGRAVLLEPYCSPVSYRLYRAFHHELTDLSVDPFADAPLSGHDALDSNQAIPTLLFFKRVDEFRTRSPYLRIVERRRLAMLAYPLSGGWRLKTALPSRLLRSTLALERLIAPLAPLLAFRCLVVLERESA